MCFPLMSKRPRQAVVVPDLSGGMNLRDSVSMVLDNQLTDARNVWFKDGVLKTRPGIDNMAHVENENWRNAEIKPHEVFYTVEGEVCRLFTAQSDTHIYFFWIGVNSFIELPAIEVPIILAKNFFVVQHNNYLYCFLGWTIMQYDVKKKLWDEAKAYVPIISTNNLPLNDDGTNPSDATMLEPYNMLGNSYSMVFSTVDKNRDTNKMEYSLLHEINDHDGEWDLAGCKIIAKIDYGNNKVATHEIEMVGSQWSETEKGYNLVDDLQMRTEGSTVKFYHKNNQETVATVKKSDHIFNNMTITAPYHITGDSATKISLMTRATWFGGAAEGISGGTRLFLGGNSTEPNLVCWSDLNNPLYFPENNYFYVGESTSPVTAFGKQSDMLVIFKDNETYYTQYQRNTGISAEAVMNQSVIDIAASSVYFPLTLINANIGCDCPNTVELCRNRLVWTNSNGKVYTLVSNNQYNERNIFEIGEMIHRKLKTEKNLKDARSIDWNGYYLLHTKDTNENKIYVLDYNSYGYQYVSSYSKTEDANLRIPWYYWDFELKAGNLQSTALAVVDGALLLVESGTYGIFKAEFNEEAAYDHIFLSDTSREYRNISQPIKSEAQTKLFEFGAQGYYKNVDKVVLSVGNNGGVPINVSFVTDMGTEETEIVPDGSQTKAYTPGYVKSMQLSPCIRQVERFGLKLSCEGPLAVDGITLTYRVTGGVR